MSQSNSAENVTAKKNPADVLAEPKRSDPLGFQVLMLDSDRNPIKGQRYRLFFAGCMVKGETGKNGLTKKISTTTSNDEVQIALERIDSTLKVVACVISGFGNKLVTIVSPKIKVESKTLAHPQAKNGQQSARNEKLAPVYGRAIPKAPTLNKQELGLRTASAMANDGRPIVKVEGDIPTSEFLSDYEDDAVTDEDYRWAAKELGLEVAIIKAFAIVESGGAGFFELGQKIVPKILYERHKFATFTNNEYSVDYPDISLPVAYYNGTGRYVLASEKDKEKRGLSKKIKYYRVVKKDDNKAIREKAMSLNELISAGEATTERDKYLAGIGSYKRLGKAYQLDQVAALKCCSWGSYQIMGEFFSAMKFKTVFDFTKFISKSPKNQVKAFVLYIKHVNPAIVDCLRDLKWSDAARLYNGPGYKANSYDVKLEKEYKKIRGET